MDIRQKLLAKKIVENNGNISKSMREVGYSKAYSKNPHQMKKTKSWTDLMEKDLPDSLLTKKHKALLNKKEYIAIGKKGEREVISTGEMDGNAVAKGLDMAYKLKGKYAPEKHKVAFEELDNLDDDELAAIAGYTKSRPSDGSESPSV